MQLSIDIEGKNLLDEVIQHYYKKIGNRTARNFLHAEESAQKWFFTYFLIDRKHVIRYGFGRDRGLLMGGLELAIGPHYFGPAAFWCYENSTRFSIEASTESVIKNLTLLDEFLGYGKDEALSYSMQIR